VSRRSSPTVSELDLLRRVRNELVDHGAEVGFQVFGTFTFARQSPKAGPRPLRRRRPATPERAEKAFQTMTERLAKAVGLSGRGEVRAQKLLYFRVVEPHETDGVHLHAAIASPSGHLPLTPEMVAARWGSKQPKKKSENNSIKNKETELRPHGNALVTPFDASRSVRAMRYLLKCLAQEGGLDWMVSDALRWS